MDYLNKIALSLKPSETLAIKAMATTLAAQGQTIFDLSSGEPDIDTPDHIKEAAVKALRDGKTKYTAVSGIIELRKALAEKYTALHAKSYSPSQVVVTNGGKQALFQLFQVLLRLGDEVIVPAPYWVSYPSMITLAGGITKTLLGDRAHSMKITPELLEGAITPQTRAFVLNSPSNPTGAVYTAEELKALGEVFLRHPKVFVITDEVYEKVVFSGQTFTSFLTVAPAELRDRTVTISAFSKSYSMTGWRVGYAVGPEQLIGAISNYQSQATSNVNSISQWAALAALSGSHDFIQGMNQNFERRTKKMMEILSEGTGLAFPIIPGGAFYLFIELTLKIKMSSTDFIFKLLEERGVASVPGEAFGDDRFFRISTAGKDETVFEGARQIRAFVDELERR